MSVRPAKTQISLGIRPVWSESSLFAWRKLGSLATIKRTAKTLIRLGSAQADLSLRWAHWPHCLFCHEAAHFSIKFSIPLQQNKYTKHDRFQINILWTIHWYTYGLYFYKFNLSFEKYYWRIKWSKDSSTCKRRQISYRLIRIRQADLVPKSETRGKPLIVSFFN